MTLTTDIVPHMEIKNVVTSAAFPHRFDLDEIAAALPSIDPNPQLHNCIMYRMDEPYAVLWIYAKGLIVTASARSEEASIHAIRTFVKLMNRLDIRTNPDPVMAVRNILANVSIGRPVNLELAAMRLEDTLYEPEQFPGLIYRPVPDITVLLLNKGKMVVTGARMESELEFIVRHTINNLVHHGALEGVM